ncbi:MAG: hypothetical protein OIF58_12510 [Cohaesibacter sp.]|nr:hypothetical protein [Cohaesibacter sp.]
MTYVSEIDWLQATEEQRKQLYVATRAVADACDTSVEEIIDAALGRKVLMGTDYISTFRRGKIRRSYAKLIHAWISENHAANASTIAPSLFTWHHTDAWRDYLKDHAIQGTLRIARFDKSMNLVQRPRRQPKPEETLRLGEEFCFHLNSDTDGYAVAFQRYKGQTHPLPLGLNDEPSIKINLGEQFLPIDETGQPEVLSETEDAGHHQFIICIADDCSRLPTQERPPQPDEGVIIYIIRLQFIG